MKHFAIKKLFAAAVVFCTFFALTAAAQLADADCEASYSGTVYSFNVAFADGTSFGENASAIAVAYDSQGKCLAVRKCLTGELDDIASTSFNCAKLECESFGIYFLHPVTLRPLANKIIVNKSDIPEVLKPERKAQSYLLCYNTSFDAPKEGLNSGWLYDGRGAGLRTTIAASQTYTKLADISDEYPTQLIRELNLVDSGEVTLETTVSFKVDTEGASIDYLDKNKNLTYSLYVHDDAFYIKLADGTGKRLCDAVTERKYRLRISLNLDKGTSKTVIDNTEYDNSSPLLSDNILSFRFRTDERSIMTLTPGTVKMYANYLVNDDFDLAVAGSKPYLWDGNATVTSSELRMYGNSTETRSFDEASGRLAYETLLMLPYGNNAYLSINSGSASVAKLEAKDGYFSVDGSNVYDFTSNMWYRVRIEVDTDSRTVRYLLNGREIAVGTVGNDFDSLDNISMHLDSGELRADDIKVSSLCEYDDYVPEPNVLPDDDYYVGINVCSLWQNGIHFGWSCVTPFDEIQPVLGYYDEGNPESADWEIKFMTEHGIDFQAFCWYCDQANAPIKAPRNTQQLHNGYMYSKYSEDMKYCLIWEAKNASHFKSDAFRNYVIPYWVENYFLDDRYMKIDNKLVLCVFGTNQLCTSEYFDTVAGAKAETDYLRSVVKSLGFDDIILLSCGSASDNNANMGFDGAYAYNWGKNGYGLEYTKNCILASANNSKMYTVPTISTGFNNVSWEGTRYPNMSVEDFTSAHEWVRDTYLPAHGRHDGGWTDKLVMISTWNEYGEGTYVMPSGLNGFGYLDTIRKVYAGRTDAHTDDVPNDNQKQRINHLYPQYARLLRKQGYYSRPIPTTVAQEIKLNSSTVTNLQSGNVSSFGSNSEYVYGTARNSDPIVTIKNMTPISALASNVVVIHAKLNKNDTFELFYITDTAATYNSTNVLRCNSISDDWQDFVFDFSETANWKGTITGLRLDPGTIAGGNFCISSVQFRDTSTDEKFNVNIDGHAVPNTIYPENDGTEIYCPFDPSTAVQFLLRSFMYWDYSSQKLTVNANKHEVVYTVGSSTAMVDGTAQDLGKAVYLTDGIPMLSFRLLAQFIGYTYEQIGNQINIYSPYYTPANSIDSVGWEFNTDGNNEGWTPTNVTVSTSSGCINLVSNSTDPLIIKTLENGIDASLYPKIRIRSKYKCDNSAGLIFGFYFTTDTDRNWDQKKYVGITPTISDTGTDFVVYTIDMSSNAYWTGTIKQLRFDPFNSSGTVSVDYIRFVDAGFNIVNGDAEETDNCAFFSSNATVSIVTDSTNSTNHCYRIASTNKANNYTYVRQNVVWIPGKIYTADYDIRVVSKYDGSPITSAEILGNVRYSDVITGSADHIFCSKTAKPSEGWVHVSTQFSIDPYSSNRSSDQFTIYANPVSGYGVVYEIDNVVVRIKSTQ